MFLVGNMREREHLEETNLDRTVIERWIFRQWDGGHGLD